MTRLLHFATGYVAVLVLLLLMSPTVAKADSFLIQGNTYPDLATATLNITTLSNTELCFTLTNTSMGVITGVGFDLPGTGTFTLESISMTGSGTYSFTTDAGNVPQFNSAVLDFAFITGDSFTGGNPPSGTAAGETTPLFCVTGDFTGLTQQQIADAIFVRFQSLPNGQSDVGRTTTPVPEPASMTLLGIGLIASAGALRKRLRKRAKGA